MREVHLGEPPRKAAATKAAQTTDTKQAEMGVAMSLGGEEGGMLVFCACEDDRNCAKVARV